MPAERRVVVGALALATLVAALLRLPFLGHESWWFDESYSVGVIGAGSPGQLWDRIGASESTPPLFYALTWLWSQLVGDRGEATLRTVSALATIASVPLAYVALRRLIGWRAALATAGILAVTPVLTSGYALDARAYGLLVLVSLLSVWALGVLLETLAASAASTASAVSAASATSATTATTRGWDAAAMRRFALWALAAAAVIWTHWFGGFLVLGEVVALLWLRPAAWRATLAAAAAVGVALLPLSGLLQQQTGDERAGFIDGYTIHGRLEQLARQFAMGANVPRTWLEAAGLALFAFGVVVGGALALRRASERVREPAPSDGARALLTVVLVSLLVPLALSALDLYDRFSIRNVLFALPLVAGIAAIGLVRLRALPLAVYLLLCVTAVVWVRSDWRYQRTDWRGAVRLTDADQRTLGERWPVIALSTQGQPVASLYLGRGASAAPLSTQRATLVIEPVRPPHQRGLAPVLSTPAEQALGALFPTSSETRLNGFRVIDYRADTPVALDPAALGGALLYPPPAP